MHDVYLFSTSPSSNRGGIASAAAAFLHCLNISGIKTKTFITHEPLAGNAKNSLIFLFAFVRFVTLIVLKAVTFKKMPVVYVHVGPKGSLARKLLIVIFARAFKIKVFTHHHSSVFDDYLSQNKAWGRALTLLSRISYKNLVLSKWWQTRYKDFGITNTHVVPNSITMRDTFTSPPTIKFDTSKIDLISIGRFDKGKNFDLLINAVEKLHGDIKINIAGDGPERKNLMDIARKSRRHRDIKFLGWVDEAQKNKLYIESDLFVLPSNHDSFGMVYIEALSHGCPVVIGPNPAVISALEGLDGVFVATDFSTASVADAINEALSCNKNKNKITISKSCVDRYGFDHVAASLISVLDLTNEKT